MTAIAAFRIRGRPSLVGDALITRDSRAIGLGRKLLIISPRLAVAWTGSRLAATIAFQQLRNLGSCAAPTVDSIAKLLTSQELKVDLAGHDLLLLGWIVLDSSEVCFRWNSLWGDQLFFSDGEPFSDGSGDSQITNTLNSALRVADATGPDDWDDKSVLVGITGDLMRPELHIQSSAPLGHGVSYEAVQLNDERRFQHLPSTLYFGVSHKLNANGQYLSSKVLDPIARVSYLQDAMIYDFSAHDGKPHLRNIVLPVAGPGRKFSDWERKVQKDKPYTFVSAYYCQFCYFDVPGFVTPALPMIFPHHRSKRMLTFFGPTSFGVQATPREVERFFAFVRQSENESRRGSGEVAMPVRAQSMPF